MNKAFTLSLVIVGIINLLPIFGLLGAQKIESAYAVLLSSNDLVILMQHRALLFGLLGGFILYSVFVPAYQSPAMIMAGISMLGFAVLVHTVGGSNGSIGRVLQVDYIGIAFLAIAVVLKVGFKDS